MRGAADRETSGAVSQRKERQVGGQEETEVWREERTRERQVEGWRGKGERGEDHRSEMMEQWSLHRNKRPDDDTNILFLLQ